MSCIALQAAGVCLTNPPQRSARFTPNQHKGANDDDNQALTICKEILLGSLHARCRRERDPVGSGRIEEFIWVSDFWPRLASRMSIRASQRWNSPMTRRAILTTHQAGKPMRRARRAGLNTAAYTAISLRARSCPCLGYRRRRMFRTRL